MFANTIMQRSGGLSHRPSDERVKVGEVDDKREGRAISVAVFPLDLRVFVHET